MSTSHSQTNSPTGIKPIPAVHELSVSRDTLGTCTSITDTVELEGSTNTLGSSDVDSEMNGGMGGAMGEDWEGSLLKKVDRYGFMGGSQYTEDGPNLPVEVARQRELKWLDMLSHWDRWMSKRFKKVRDNDISDSTTHPIWRTVKPHPKVKQRCRKGIPASLRGRAWQYLSGSKKYMEANPGKFDEMDKLAGDPVWVEVIEKDLHRQFPFHEMFCARGGHGQQDLYRILKAYSIYNPVDGYCQAQAPVAAVLLMHMPAEQAFWCLVAICEKYMSGYYSSGLEAVQIDGMVLNGLLKKAVPNAYKHLKKLKVEPILYMTEWFMCLFSRTLPWSSVLRVWDMFLCEGVKVIFKVAIVLLKNTLGQPAVLRECPGLYETMEKLRNIPPEVMQEDFLSREIIELKLGEQDLAREHHIQLEKWRATHPNDSLPRSRAKAAKQNGKGPDGLDNESETQSLRTDSEFGRNEEGAIGGGEQNGTLEKDSKKGKKKKKKDSKKDKKGANEDVDSVSTVSLPEENLKGKKWKKESKKEKEEGEPQDERIPPEDEERLQEDEKSKSKKDKKKDKKGKKDEEVVSVNEESPVPQDTQTVEDGAASLKKKKDKKDKKLKKDADSLSQEDQGSEGGRFSLRKKKDKKAKKGKKDEDSDSTRSGMSPTHQENQDSEGGRFSLRKKKDKKKDKKAEDTDSRSGASPVPPETVQEGRFSLKKKKKEKKEEDSDSRSGASPVPPPETVQEGRFSLKKKKKGKKEEDSDSRSGASPVPSEEQVLEDGKFSFKGKKEKKRRWSKKDKESQESGDHLS
ncbi:PREDICTED: TBC1 domain family member 10A-like isoform X1 [Branchiostoma belcheri]|uniref:TBC1 domain family member 10A-like isoform X1 n=1 Tax=Branchiostoma belcheri TaxID=7741 RepID=A0A6P4XQI9_BRABE|nr:PREDICTED: TBC1 domain family member 10A-like isoform X1 [Branchiostoma belcheri]